jgi:PAS domain S-box-containing protein
MLHSLGARAIAYFVLVALLATVGISALVVVQVSSTISQDLAEHLSLAADSAYHAANNAIARSLADTQMLADNRLIRSRTESDAAKEAELAKAKTILRVYEDVTLFDTDGSIIASTDYSLRGLPQYKPQFREALEGSFTVSGVHAVPEPLKVVVDFMGPVYDEEEQLLGVISARLNMMTVWDILKDIRLGRTGHALLLDHDHTIIGSPDASATLSTVNAELSEQLRRGEPLLRYKDPGGASMVGGWSTSDRGVDPGGRFGVDWIVVVVQSEREALRPLYSLVVRVILLASVMLAFSALLGIRYARSIAGPIRELAQTARALGEGDLERAIDTHGVGEVGALASSFARMRDSVRDKVAALQASEARYRRLYDGMTDGFVRVDMAGTILESNTAFQEMLGYGADELRKLTYTDITPRRWHDFEADIIEEQVKTRGISELYEKEYVRADGTRFPVELQAHVIRDADGAAAGMWAMVRDITARKEAEHSLARLRNLLGSIVNCMPSVLVGVDRDLNVVQWNPAAERATGIATPDAIGKALLDAVPELAGQLPRVHDAMRTRETQTVRKAAHGKGDETRFRDVTIYPLVGGDLGGVVILVDDVTERVRIEEMMVQSEKMASVGGLAAGAAHEINNPLAGILQNVQVVRDRLCEDMPKNRQVAEQCGIALEALRAYVEGREIPSMLESVLESGKRAAAIVANMLSFSRKSSADLTHHDLAELLDKTLELAGSDYDLKKKFDFRTIEIVREFQDDVLTVQCEGGGIQQVFLNILRNGALAMAERHGACEPARFVLRLMRDGEMARVEIEDNGPGMEEAVRKRVFEPFFTTKEVGIGTGLGLSVSYFIVVENHCGRMAVESTPGAGSKFIVMLPLDPQEARAD